jgi:squalene-hopene/tetraprenyl-beta-curcumene cyclase
VPDSDDTSGALLALRRLGDADATSIEAAAAGIRWLMGVQNRDGGIPTFCRGWGTLPFDRSTPEITAHALQAWSVWYDVVDTSLQNVLTRASARAFAFLAKTQRADGSWIPLWFGNEHAPDEDNPVYGTARVLMGLRSTLVEALPGAAVCRRRAIDFLIRAQNGDGGWGGAPGTPSTIEETGVALSALARAADDRHAFRNLDDAVARGLFWLTEATASGPHAAPIGLYFARLWYYEDLYPLVFALSGLASTGPDRRPATID